MTTKKGVSTQLLRYRMKDQDVQVNRCSLTELHVLPEMVNLCFYLLIGNVSKQTTLGMTFPTF